MCVMKLPLQTMDLRLRDNRHVRTLSSACRTLICSATIARFVNIESKICKMTLTKYEYEKTTPGDNQFQNQRRTKGGIGLHR